MAYSISSLGGRHGATHGFGRLRRCVHGLLLALREIRCQNTIPSNRSSNCTQIRSKHEATIKVAASELLMIFSHGAQRRNKRHDGRCQEIDCLTPFSCPVFLCGSVPLCPDACARWLKRTCTCLSQLRFRCIASTQTDNLSRYS